MRKFGIIAIILAAAFSSAQAAQVAISNFNQPFPIAIFGESVAAGTGFVSIGIVQGMSDADISAIATTSDPSGLDAAFTQFGTSLQFGASGFSGFFQGDIGEAILPGSPFIGGTIYLIAGDGEGITSSRGLMVYKTSTTLEQDNPLYSTEVILDRDFSEAGLLLGGRVAGIDVPGVGAFDGIDISGPLTPPEECIDDPSHPDHPECPEPTTATLVLFGACGVFLRRRRRS